MCQINFDSRQMKVSNKKSRQIQKDLVSRQMCTQTMTSILNHIGEKNRTFALTFVLLCESDAQTLPLRAIHCCISTRTRRDVIWPVRMYSSQLHRQNGHSCYTILYLFGLFPSNVNPFISLRFFHIPSYIDGNKCFHYWYISIGILILSLAASLQPNTKLIIVCQHSVPLVVHALLSSSTTSAAQMKLITQQVNSIHAPNDEKLTDSAGHKLHRVLQRFENHLAGW